MATPSNRESAAVERWSKLAFSDKSEEEVQEFYAFWAEKYDDDLHAMNSTGSRRGAEMLAGLVPEASRAEVEILDIACGTGLSGLHYWSRGFRAIDGVDRSPDMLERCQSKKIYRSLMCSSVGGGQRLEGIPDDTYDIVMISGGFAKGHLPIDCLREACRVLKPGGIFMNAMTGLYLKTVPELRSLEPLMAQMESEGLWTMVGRTTEGHNHKGAGGNLYHTFRKSGQ